MINTPVCKPCFASDIINILIFNTFKEINSQNTTQTKNFPFAINNKICIYWINRSDVFFIIGLKKSVNLTVINTAHYEKVYSNN